MNSSNNNSSWAIIDPSLRNPDLVVYDFKKTTNLDYALPIYTPSIATNPDTFATHTDKKMHKIPKQKIEIATKGIGNISEIVFGKNYLINSEEIILNIYFI